MRIERAAMLLLCVPCVIATLYGQSNVWQQTDFPQLSDAKCRTIHVAQNGTVFVGTAEDGLMRSMNNGDAWERSLPAKGHGFDRWSIATTASGTVFALSYTGLRRSTDNGATWSQVGDSLWWNKAGGFVVTSNDHIFASTIDYGVLRSTDGGDTWTGVNNGLGGSPYNFHWMVVSPLAHSPALYLGLGYDSLAFYRSTDDGDTWIRLPLVIAGGEPFVHSNGDLYIGGFSGTKKAIRRSTDRGITWQPVARLPMLSFPDGEVWADDVHLVRSTDYGVTWSALPADVKVEAQAMARTPNGMVFVGTWKNGMFRTTDNGATWGQCNAGFPEPMSEVTGITGTQGTTRYAATSVFGSFVSTNAGQSWARNYPGNLDVSRLAVHASSALFAASKVSGGPLRVSPDGGNNWQYIPWKAYVYATDVAIDEKGVVYSCGQNTGVLRSADAGQSWTWLPCPGTTFPRMHVTPQGTIVVLTPFESGSVEYPVVRYYTRISTDTGATWNVSAPGGDLNPVYEYASTRNGFIFASTELALFCSSDAGASWQPTGLLSIPDVYSLAVNSSDIIFAGSVSRGVLRSTDYGATWAPFNNGLTGEILSLYCDADGFLYAGTRTTGIFKTIGATTSVGDQPDALPLAFRLEQNFPNPFNMTTIISFQLPARGPERSEGVDGPAASRVRLIVYDLLGREVAVLADEDLGPGIHRRVFDAKGLASGTYVCRFEAGSFTQTRALLLLK